MDTESITSEESAIQAVHPGFFHLEISIFSGRGQDNVSRIISFLESKRAEEHPIVHSAIENLICVCMCLERNRRLEAAKRLTRHNVKHPENLNTLVNLGHLLREAHRFTESDACLERVSELMERRGRKYEILRAQCSLEQAYVYTFMHSEQTGFEIVNDGINRIVRRLTDLEKCCELEDTKLLVRGAKSRMHETARDLMILEHGKPRKVFDRETCLGLYDSGLEMLAKQPGTELDIQIWSYYQAVLNYFLSEFNESSTNSAETGSFRHAAAQHFLRVFNSLDRSVDELKIYRARCLGYLGHLLSVSFEGKGDVYKATLETFKITVSQQGGVSLYLFDKSKIYQADDFIVSAIEARFYLYKALHKTVDPKEKKRLLDRAHSAASKSLQIHNNNFENHLAFVLQRDTNHNLFHLSSHQKENYLREAKESAEQCIHAGSVNDHVTLGRICLDLALCPPGSRKLSAIPDWEDVMYEGIDSIQQALEIGVQGDRKCQCFEILARAFHELKQYRPAIECLKRLVEKAFGDKSNLYLDLFKNLFELCKETKARCKKTSTFVYCEVLFWLTHAKDRDIALSSFVKLSKTYKGEMEEFKVVLKDILGTAKNGFDKCDLNDVLQKIEKSKAVEKISSRSVILPLKLHRSKNEEIVNKNSISPSTQNGLLKREYVLPHKSMVDRFDYVVCNHQADKEWVMHVLRPALEESFACQQLIGYLQDRDYPNGLSYMEHIKERVADNVIMVLSDAFLECEWPRIEDDTELLHIIGYKASDGHLFPIMLCENRELPPSLNQLVCENVVYIHAHDEWDILRKYLS